MCAKRKQKQRDRLRKRKDNYVVTLGRDIKIQVAEEKSKELALVALEDEIEHMRVEEDLKREEAAGRESDQIMSKEAIMMTEIAQKFAHKKRKRNDGSKKKRSTKLPLVAMLNAKKMISTD